jgi:hypothetical protein
MMIRADGCILNIEVENIVHFVSAKPIDAREEAQSIFKQRVNISAFPIFGMS